MGIPQPLPRSLRGFIPNYTMPADGYVADNVTVTMGQVLSLARPYFYPLNSDVPFDGTAGTTQLGPPHDDGTRPPPNEGSVDLNDPNYAPILTIPQDIEVYAPPAASNRANVTNYELRFPKLVLQGGVPQAEAANAIAQPLNFQLPICYAPPCGSSAGSGQIAVWQNATYSASTQLWVPQQIPEGGGVPYLWPLVVLTKLIDDPPHAADPASVTQQGSQNGGSVNPVVVLQGITLLGDTNSNPPPGLFDTTAAAAGGALLDASGRPIVSYQHSLTVLLRPNVICFDSLYDNSAPDKRGTLVTPYLTGVTADLPNGTPAAAIVPLSVLQNPSIAALVKPPVLAACLPTGRYAINAVYPDGQAWTVPNEAGACQGTEGMTDYKTMTCTAKPRSVLRSQGTRAVVEITKTTDPNHCTGYQAVPRACLPH